jgi:hypothetical protein
MNDRVETQTRRLIAFLDAACLMAFVAWIVLPKRSAGSNVLLRFVATWVFVRLCYESARYRMRRCRERM